MAAKTIEARLVISGEDKGASASIASVVKSVRQLEEVSKISAPLQRMAKDFQQVEQASKAVNSAMAARSGLATAEAGLRATQGAAQAAAKALEQAKVARAAFDGVKASKGSAEAKQIEAATKAVRDYTAAQKKADGDVRRATAAVAAQSSALQHADSAAVKFGADLGNLESHQQRLRTTTEAATDAMRRQVRVEEQAARATAHHAKEEAEFLRHRRTHGLIGAGAAVASGAVSVHGVGHVVAESAKSGAEVQSNRVDMAKAGIGFAERQHITDESLKLAVQYKNVTQASVMELWKEMRSVMTDPHEVDHIIDPMVRAKSLLDAKDKTGTASHGLNMLVKGAEAIGAAKDPERFTKLLDGYLKAMQVMGSTVTPEGIYEMQKYSKTSGGRWSDRFIMTTAQSLGQELGGSTAGNSIDVATRQIVGGMQNLHSKAKEFARVGLIDRKNLDILKTGEVKGTKAGVKHAVKGDDLAASDLDQWVYTVLLPHLEKAGIKTESDQMAWVQKNFTGTGANVVSKLIQQRESFEAHAKMYEGATGLKGADLNRSDPNAGMGALSKSFETFLGVVASPMMVEAAHALDSISAGIGSFSLRIDEFNKAHPTIAKFEAPVAAGVGLAGAGLASAAVFGALSTGFGLPSAAAELTVAAKMLQGSAVEKGLPGAAAGVPAFVGLGLGTAAIGLGAAGIVAGAATAAELPKIAEKEGPAAIDPATGEHLDTAVPETTPWVRNWITSWFTKPEVADEAGKAIGKGIVDAPLPPKRPTMLEDFKTKADETGAEAGKTLLQKIIEAVGTGINIPISFVPGAGTGGGSGVQTASFGGSGGLGGLIQRASLGGSGAGGGGGGGVFRRGGAGGGGVRTYDAPTGPYLGTGSTAGSLTRLSEEAAQAAGIDPRYLHGIRAGESGHRDNYDVKSDRVEDSYGPFQMNRRGGLGQIFEKETGLSVKDPRTIADQARWVARHIAKKLRANPNYNPGTEWFGYRGRREADPKWGNSGYRPSGSKAADGEPRLIRGLDGKEGLDLGDGTMRMPDGSIRSITRSGAQIPDLPAGGLGVGGGGRADMQAAADRMHAAAERFENANMHAQVEVTGLHKAGLRATSVKVRTRGGITGDMGVTMPGAKEDLSDWT